MSQTRKTRRTHTKITLAQATQIVQRLEAGETIAAIAQDTGIRSRLLLRIMRNETFMSVPRSMDFGERRIKPRKPLPQEIVMAMWNSYFIGGKTCSDIAKDTGIEYHRVRHIINGKSHKAMTKDLERPFPGGARGNRREAVRGKVAVERVCGHCAQPFTDVGRFVRKTCGKECAQAHRNATRMSNRLATPAQAS